MQSLVLVALALAALSTAETAKTVFAGQIQVTAVHVKEGGRERSLLHEETHFQQLHLRLRSGELRLLKFPNQLAVLPRSGTWVVARTLPLKQCGLDDTSSILCVGSLMAHEDAPRDVFSPGQPRGPVQLKALVMQLQVCGQGPATTPEKLTAALFDDQPGSQAETVQGMFKSCSSNNAEFNLGIGTQVVTATIPIPCSGKTPWNMPFDSMLCPFTEWSDVANQYVMDVLGYNWQDFKYKIYVVPPGDLCSWGGMGWVGCKVDCRAWISGDLWQYPTTWMHELGHNLYLNHAGSYQKTGGGGQPAFVSYKDDSGAMGHCCSTRCFNAPHSFQLGWSNPVDVLHKDTLPAGEWRSYTLPPRVGSQGKQQNMLRVRGDWSDQAAGYNMWIEYRKGVDYDGGLYATVRDKVTMYSTPLGDAMPYTTFEAAISENQIFRETRLGSNLAVWVGSESSEGISVHVCRPSSAQETDCGNGKDDDCDGFTDAEDPDCQPQVGAQAASRRLLQRQPLPAKQHDRTLSFPVTLDAWQ